MRVVPEALSWEKVSDRQWRLDFVLPPGSYATSLLRELLDAKEGEGGE
jgi:tRNA(Glu) U13 pseudouridine synthase TruD